MSDADKQRSFSLLGSGLKMADVAKAAGVATSTVSRALAYPDRISAKTREKILRAAEQLGYTPNVAARNLRKGSTRMILIVLPPRIHSEPISRTTRGIDDALVAAGYSLIIGNFDRLEATERHILDLAYGGSVDGAIVLSSPIPTSGERSLRQAGIPVVSALNDLSGMGIPSIVTDEQEAMRAMVARLVDDGHRHFAYVGGPADSYHEQMRFAGFSAALQEAGSAARVDRFEGDYLFESGRQAALQILRLRDRPSAMVCANDDMAIAALRELKAGGLKVPDDIALTGFDGISYAKYVDPELTTVSQPFDEIGRKAANLLLDCIAHAEEVPMRTVLRNSLSPGASAFRR